MNVKKFKELIETTEFVGTTDNYLIHKFTEGGNYLIIDTYGDFLILERDKIESVFSTIWLRFLLRSERPPAAVDRGSSLFEPGLSAILPDQVPPKRHPTKEIYF